MGHQCDGHRGAPHGSRGGQTLRSYRVPQQPVTADHQVGAVTGGHGLDGVEAHLVVEDLDLLGLPDGDGAGDHPQEDAVPDDDAARALHHNAGGRQVAEGGRLHQEEFYVVDANLQLT